MGEHTGIEWADSTFNPWWGCTRVSPACDHCYAATFATRYNFGWGASSPPRVFGDKHWNEPLKWDREAAKTSTRPRVFCASMADVFERRGGEHGATLNRERKRLLQRIDDTPNLDWLLLTKRPENVPELLSEASSGGIEDFRHMPNVWLGTTVEDQRRADERLDHLLNVGARVHFVSAEPLLGALDLRRWFRGPQPDGTDNMGGLDWVIAGGESGPGARPTHPDWFRSLRDQCAAAGVAFHFKQWGDWAEFPQGSTDNSQVIYRGEPEIPGRFPPAPMRVWRAGKKLTGRILDGRTWDEVPA